MSSLPIVEIYPELIASLQQQPMALLQAPPGAGKSTWLPLQLIRDGHFKHIVMLEPRRLAARNIANYLAKCQNEPLGESIGLRIRQEKFVSSKTKLEIVTEGMLTRILQSDPELTGIDCIIFDEFHERSMNADMALAFALETQALFRDDLKILLMSATLDADSIVQKWQCPVISSQGRSFPIDEVYHPLRDDSRWLYEIPKLIQQAITEQQGSCLVFLPGRREIDFVAKELAAVNLENCHIYSLYGDQNKSSQQAAIAPATAGQRKIVLATNVAETSLTIEGIRIVVDSGKRRAASYHLKTAVMQLETVSISMSSAIQRAGRAGRIEPGIVYRLGSEAQFKHRPTHDIPEILSADISQLMLEAKYWGTDIEQLDLLDQPSEAQLKASQDLLIMLEALDDNLHITDMGKQLLTYGTDIRWAHMLIKAKNLDAQHPQLFLSAVYLLALLDSRASREADIITAMQQQISSPLPQFKQQLKFWLRRLKLNDSKNINLEYLPILIALAYPDRIAKKRGKGYLLANGAGVNAKDNLWINNDYLAIADLGGKNGAQIFSACTLDIDYLKMLLPSMLQKKTVCEFDERQERFIHESRTMLGAIILESNTQHEAISQELILDAWLGLVQRKGLSLFNDFSEQATNKSHQLLIRMQLAHQFFPDDFPPAHQQHLIASLDSWLTPFLNHIKTVTQLKKVDIYQALQNLLDWSAQQRLDEYLPPKLKVPTGSTITIQYQLNGPAKLSVRMQEVFGISDTPTLAKGKLPLLMDLLSPAQRSLQLTQDLAGFWQSSYKEVQKEMKGRYPKHFWPDDPATAKPTTRVKNKM